MLNSQNLSFSDSENVFSEYLKVLRHSEALRYSYMVTENKKLSDEELLRNIKSTDKISSGEAAVLVERYMNIVRVKALTTVARYP